MTRQLYAPAPVPKPAVHEGCCLNYYSLGMSAAAVAVIFKTDVIPQVSECKLASSSNSCNQAPCPLVSTVCYPPTLPQAGEAELGHIFGC